MMMQNFDQNSFRDFEYIAGMDAWARAKMFQAYSDDQTAKSQFNYRLLVSSGCGPTVTVDGQEVISLVCNDYLGFTIFPVRIGDKIKNAQIRHALRAKSIYANQINYPAVALKDARIRMGVTALHRREHIDKVIGAWAEIKTEFEL